MVDIALALGGSDCERLRSGWLAQPANAVSGPVYAAGRASAAWMAPALVAYVAGRSGSSLCRPASLLQPHAAWHVLSAVGLGLAVVASAVSSGGDRARP